MATIRSLVLRRYSQADMLKRGSLGTKQDQFNSIQDLTLLFNGRNKQRTVFVFLTFLTQEKYEKRISLLK